VRAFVGFVVLTVACAAVLALDMAMLAREYQHGMFYE
jgi:hypothetical protein